LSSSTAASAYRTPGNRRPSYRNPANLTQSHTFLPTAERRHHYPYETTTERLCYANGLHILLRGLLLNVTKNLKAGLKARVRVIWVLYLHIL
jgi:hypothetical protein